MQQRDEIKRLTRKHFGAATHRQIAIDMGNVVSQQQAASYLNDGALPQSATLIAIIRSVSSKPFAKAWARECLRVVMPDVEVTIREPEVDQVN